MTHTDLKLPNSCITSLTINFSNPSKLCFHQLKKDTVELPGKPLTTMFLFPLFIPIMVKGLSLSLVSKHGITFPRISDLLTQNMHLVQNTLYTYTVSTRKFDRNELRETVVCVWQFFVDHY